MTDPFETLGIEASFDLDLDSLAERHRALSGALHPDRYASRTAGERRLALEKAVAVNEAWRTLRDPVKRAETLLRRSGVEVGETGEPKPSPELLMEMMEIREELAEAQAKRDLDRIHKLADRMRAREARVIEKLKVGFARGDKDPLVPVLGELRYIRRFFEQLDAIEEELLN
ncbi:MAG TPA: Fe-S protein assembly co-chaperone HscB [Polyangiaceae bacterium]|nr:Fe-S protein assembly co-chaperone HscB [Polyangiaceae bacterium]